MSEQNRRAGKDGRIGIAKNLGKNWDFKMSCMRQEVATFA